MMRDAYAAKENRLKGIDENEEFIRRNGLARICDD